jgi:uncharacterized protein YdaU (DUF1376 family)
MKWDERGAYILLLMESWLTGGRLPNDKSLIRRLLVIDDDDDCNRIEKTVLPMFQMSECGNFLQNNTLIETLNEVRKLRLANSIGGKKGMENRWKNKTVISQLLVSNNNQNQNQNQINKKETKEKKKFGECVFLKEEELERLEVKYGKEITQKAIRFLDDYLANNPKKRKQYSDHNRCIHNWVITAVKEKMAREKKADDIIGVQKSSSSMVSKFIPPPKDKPEEEGNLPI